MNAEKQWVQIKDIPYVYIDSSIFEGDIIEICKKLKNIKNLLKEAYQYRNQYYCDGHGVTFTDFKDYQKISIVRNYNMDSGWDFNLKVERLETDEELKARIKKQEEHSKRAQAKKRKSSQEKRERALLETLKKKYENTI